MAVTVWGQKGNSTMKREDVQMFIARLLPRWLVYWAAIRLGVNATTGEWSHQNVPELYFTDALQRWEK